MPDLFEIAQQVATPDYVAAKIAVIESHLANAHICLAVAVVVTFICAVAAIVSFMKFEECESDKQGNLLLGIYIAALIIGFIALIALIGSLNSLLSLPSQLAQWTCDPVTEIARSLADAI